MLISASHVQRRATDNGPYVSQLESRLLKTQPPRSLVDHLVRKVTQRTVINFGRPLATGQEFLITFLTGVANCLLVYYKLPRMASWLDEAAVRSMSSPSEI